MIIRSTAIRRTTVCVAAALAISLSSVATAGVLDRVKSRVQSTAAKAGTVVKIVRERQPVATAFRNAGQNLPGSNLFDIVKEFRPKEQLRETIELIRELHIDYAEFSGDAAGCQAKCGVFRESLADVFEEFASIVQQVPGLRKRRGLVQTFDRLPTLIDHVPPRALYLMWQALGGKIDELGSAAENIRQMLESLPPFVSISDIAGHANMKGAFDANRPICNWVNEDNRPVVEWIQAELETAAWSFKMVEGMIPDVSVKAEVGGEAGVAVANATAAAGASVKPTDTLKIALKALAGVAEGIKLAINVNIHRAKVVCLATN